jgi:hypothetical protein
VVTKNEKVDWVRSSRMAEMIRFSKLRNIQLHHSRTIITVFMRMLTAGDSDIAPIAARLLEHLPQQLERPSKGYAKMTRYLEHLSKGGQRRAHDDLVAANTYTSRSAAFGPVKTEVSEACKNKEWDKMKDSCQGVMDKHAEITSLWKVNTDDLKVQNMKVYKDLLDADFGDDIDEATKAKNNELTRKALGDAEKQRVAWQVGKKGEFGNDIEPLDEVFLHEILTGEKPESLPDVGALEQAGTGTTAMVETQAESEFAQFRSSMQPCFITTMQKDISAESVCRSIDVPTTAMRVFIKALNPQFVWEDLGKNYKSTILGLLKDRSHRIESRPTKMLLGLVSDRMKLQIDG